MSTARVRASLIWHEEVMSDVVLDGAMITLGNTKRSTFLVPADLRLPKDFPIIRRGDHGYVLTLGTRMRGTFCIDGLVKDVEQFVGGGDSGGGGDDSFRATPIGGRDWGVIELDDSGSLKLFFQFVDTPTALPKTRTALELLLPALAFSAVLHLIFLLVAYGLEQKGSAFVWPGPRSLTGNYLATHLKPDPPPPPPPPPAPGAATTAPASATGQVKNVKSASKGDEGKSGGKGDTERARDPNARDVPAVPPPQVALLNKTNRAVLDNIIHDNSSTDLDKFYTGIKGDARRGSVGNGKGSGTGAGDDADGTGTTRGSQGKGSGGGGNVDGDYVTKKGPIDAGEQRTAKGTGGDGTGPREIAVKPGTASGDFGSLTREEIDKVVRGRANLIKACYQRELNRKRDLSGKLVVNFVIAADGTVKSTRIDPGGSSLRDEGVESCVRTIVTKLRFPAKGGGIVNYPFLFSQGA